MTPDPNPTTPAANRPADGPPTADRIATASRLVRRIAQQTSRVVVGRPRSIQHATYGIMTGGHCLFEDVPGLAKTTLVKAMAQAAGLEFSRIQFTPDLLPADISGSYIFNMKDQTFDLRRGPVFAQIVLADELNRTPPKTQAALLEAMQEQQVTLEGTTHALPAPFLVYATQNPIESEGVYILPEAQLDRFMMRISLGYPDEDEERQILARVEGWRGRPPVVEPVCSARDILRIQEITHRITVHPDLKAYIVRLVHATRNDPRVLVGSSPRGGIALMAAAKAAALFHGRDHATEDDVKDVAEAVLGHRILMDPEMQARGATPPEVVRDALGSVPTPRVPQVSR